MQELCREVLASSDDAAVKNTRKMQALMHCRIEELRSKLTVLASIQPPVVSTAVNKKIA
jgi:hypothetical protein